MSNLTPISPDDCLLDIDETAWQRVFYERGGCRCNVSPPCAACSEPISEAELNEVGYTYAAHQATKEPR